MTATEQLISAVDFQAAMGQFASGVTVVTTVLADGSPAGCTVNAFCSLSDRPPMVLVCIGRARLVHDALVTAPGYAVTVLAAHQGDLARRFGRPGTERFRGVPLREGRHGIPLPVGGVATIECDLDRAIDGGDHTILLGAVRRVRVDGGEPLLYLRGRLRG